MTPQKEAAPGSESGTAEFKPGAKLNLCSAETESICQKRIFLEALPHILRGKGRVIKALTAPEAEISELKALRFARDEIESVLQDINKALEDVADEN